MNTNNFHDNLELAKNKLLILYIVKNFNHKLKDNDLSYFVLNIELFNYFYFKQYLTELETYGLILFDNDLNYYLSDDGLNALNLFIKDIPKDQLDFLDEKISEYSHEIVLKNSITSKIIEDGDLIYVVLKILDGDIEVLNLKLEVSTRDMAEKICTNFKKNPQEFYSTLLKRLI